MRIACWITKATDTLRTRNTNLFFSRQQWLRERASLLHYTYIAGRVLISGEPCWTPWSQVVVCGVPMWTAICHYMLMRLQPRCRQEEQQVADYPFGDIASQRAKLNVYEHRKGTSSEEIAVILTAISSAGPPRHSLL
jgi:hypothetical protein